MVLSFAEFMGFESQKAVVSIHARSNDLVRKSFERKYAAERLRTWKPRQDVTEKLHLEISVTPTAVCQPCH